ncbi:MAG: hypothetical protein V3T08_09925 [Gemmatimonadota bacterium]
MMDTRRALEGVKEAREGRTLRAPDWDLIAAFLSELLLRGVHEPDELAGRLERRGHCSAFDAGKPVFFSPGGRRRGDYRRNEKP